MMGIAGAHRTGKSTLAKEFATRNGWHFITSSASKVFANLGMDPAKTYSFDERLIVQEAILKNFELDYRSAPLGVMSITDRTPLDLLAYTLAEVTGSTLNTQERRDRLTRYVNACVEATNCHFSALLVLQPGITPVVADGKGAMCPHYIEHLNSIILGLAVDERIKPAHFYIPRYMTDLEDRIGALGYAFQRASKRSEVELEDTWVH
jgi:hypothetical protein